MNDRPNTIQLTRSRTFRRAGILTTIALIATILLLPLIVSLAGATVSDAIPSERLPGTAADSRSTAPLGDVIIFEDDFEEFSGWTVERGRIGFRTPF